MWVCLTSVNTLKTLVNHHVPPFKKAMPGGFAIFRDTHMTKEAPKAVRPPLWGAAPSAQDGTKSMAENVFLPLLAVPWLLPFNFQLVSYILFLSSHSYMGFKFIIVVPYHILSLTKLLSGMILPSMWGTHFSFFHPSYWWRRHPPVLRDVVPIFFGVSAAKPSVQPYWSYTLW